MRGPSARSLLAAAALASSALAASAVTAVAPATAAPRLVLPTFEHAWYGFAAEAGDATAIFLNPAGLSAGVGTNLYADLSGNEDGAVEWSACLQGKTLGFAYRHREPRKGDRVAPAGERAATDGGSLDSYTLAGGYGPSTFRLGASATWTKTTLAGEDGFAWGAGFQSQLDPTYSVGATVENIGHPGFLDGELRPRYTYGLTMRAIPGLLTVNLQGSHLDGDADKIEMHYGARVTPIPGWSFSALVADRPGEDPSAGLSVTWFFGKGAASARLRTTSGNDDVQGQAALQIYDEFWQEGTRGPGRPRVGRRP